MIKNPIIFEQFEREQIKREKPNYIKSLRIFEGLWKEAMHMGVLPLKDSLDGIDVDIRMARILNCNNV